MPKIAIFGYSLRFPMEGSGSPRTICKIFSECQRMTKVPNGEETLPKISTG